MAKGFSDPVVSITDDKVDVVIHASLLQTLKEPRSRTL